MDSTVGLVCDPDEYGLGGDVSMLVDQGTSTGSEGNSLQVEISKNNEREKSLGIFTSFSVEASHATLCQQNGREENSAHASQDIFGSPAEDADILTFLQKTDIKDERFSILITSQNSQPLTLSWETYTHAEVTTEEQIQSTIVFETVEPTQGWTFSQIQSSAKHRDTQNTPPTDATLSQTDSIESSIEIKKEDTQSTVPLYQELSEIPTPIRNLYSSVTEQYSDYCFSYMLAAQLCQDVIPMSAYNHLKLSLLLSIASIQKTSQSQPFHVISLGSETAISQLLMSSIGQLARRFVTGMLDPLAGGRVLEDNFIECGATTLARTGVCYIGDWSMQKTSNATRILREIESGQVIIENHSITYPLECAIWTSWNYTRKVKQDLSSMVTFFNAFGIPIVLPEQSPDSVVDFILERSLADYDTADQEVLVPEEDVRQFLAMLYFQEVTMSEEASKLLSDYFVATRLNIPESLTQSSFSALCKITEAHARLCFRNEVIRLDAVVAIMICERFIHRIYTNPANAAPLVECFDTIDDLEQHLHKFDRWLKDFLRRTTHS